MAHRKYLRVRVGDRLGSREVVRLMPRDRTSNERVAWVCDCGRAGVGYVFNLRKSPRCPTCGRTGRPTGGLS